MPRLHFCHNFVLRVDADQAVDIVAHPQPDADHCERVPQDVVVDEQPQAVTSHEQAQEEHDDHPREEEAPVLLPHALDEQSRADDEHQEVENHESPG